MCFTYFGLCSKLQPLDSMREFSAFSKRVDQVRNRAGRPRIDGRKARKFLLYVRKVRPVGSCFAVLHKLLCIFAYPKCVSL